MLKQVFQASLMHRWDCMRIRHNIVHESHVVNILTISVFPSSTLTPAFQGGLRRRVGHLSRPFLLTCFARSGKKEGSGTRLGSYATTIAIASSISWPRTQGVWFRLDSTGVPQNFYHEPVKIFNNHKNFTLQKIPTTQYCSKPLGKVTKEQKQLAVYVTT